MSIANNSLLRRILTEVRDAPKPIGSSPPLRRADATQLIELRRTLDVHTPPFATPLHFWAHALRGFLEAHGRPELFEALAANCLCEAVAAERAGPTLEQLAGRVTPALDLGGPDFTSAYRMIDQQELVSWVAERRGEFVALFWARPEWIDTAQPLEFE